MSPRALRILAASLLALVILAVSCGRDSEARRPLRVFAAASLTDAFDAVALAFEAEHPAVDVRITYAGSQVLRLQLEHGARADLFASANRAYTTALAELGLTEPATVFAQNELAVVVPHDNPARIETFADLPRAQTLVLGAPRVPLGAYTQRALNRADAALGAGFAQSVRARVVSRESNARLVLAKVILGEADAAVVYRSDARSSNPIRVIPIPAAVNVAAKYPIACLRDAAQPAAAALFVAFIQSPRGQAILRRHGFSPAP